MPLLPLETTRGEWLSEGKGEKSKNLRVASMIFQMTCSHIALTSLSRGSLGIDIQTQTGPCQAGPSKEVSWSSRMRPKSLVISLLNVPFVQQIASGMRVILARLNEPLLESMLFVGR